MDLSSILSSFGSDPNSNYSNLVNGLSGMFGSFQGAQNANNVNQQVQPQIQNNAATIQQQIDALNGQINTNRQQAQDMYGRSLQDVTGQNNGLQGNIDTMTTNLNALSDPNSAYMQNARQAIERKDAAAGRNSQWGDRETQLAGTLAQYVSQYAPGLQNSITGARNQINQNNQGLASLYSQANAPADRNSMTQLQLLQQQLSNANAANTTGRNSANAATNSMFGTGGVVQSGLGALKGLAGLWGGGGAPTSNSYAPESDMGMAGAQGGDSQGYYTQDSGVNPFNSTSGLGSIDWGNYGGGGNYSGYTTGGSLFDDY